MNYKIPNIRAVPNNCIHLVDKGDVVYVVPGDGACGPNCASAFLFKDEVFGKKLRRKMNKFQAKHWYKRYCLITQCSSEHPFVRKLGKGEIRFTDPEELIKYLDSSEEASGMWSDSEDLSVIADMYQVRIKIITTDVDMDPTVSWIHPDESLKEHSEFKDVTVGDMVLLHDKDYHFNLIVPGDSDLATVGSLSYRSNIGPLIDIDLEEDDTEMINEEEEAKSSETEADMKTMIANLKRELKKEKESKNVMKQELTNCEKQLKLKTEETVKLNIEIKDLKEILELEELEKDENNAANDDNKSNEENVHDISSKSPWNMPKDKDARKSKKNSEVEYNCTECFFQASNNNELRNHINIKHRIQASNMEGSLKCRNCGKAFENKYNLMIHRKEEHLAIIAYCRNNAAGNCPYTSVMCWWNHADPSREENRIKCFICGKTSTTKANLMNHRKKEHSNMVRNCNLFLQNMCRFNEEACWFKHDDNVEMEDVPENDQELPPQSVFRKVQENLEPPLKKQN